MFFSNDHWRELRFALFHRTSVWRLRSRRSSKPSKASLCSTSITRSTWYDLPPPKKEIWTLVQTSPAHWLPLLSVAETREEKRRRAEEEGVGGSGTGEDSDQAQVLQRGSALLLSPPSPFHLALESGSQIAFYFRWCKNITVRCHREKLSGYKRKSHWLSF